MAVSAFLADSLQKAVFSVLKANTALMARLDGVYDRPPSGRGGVYAIFGGVATSQYDVSDRLGTQISFTISLWSEEISQIEVHELMAMIDACLQSGKLQIQGGELHRLTFQNASVDRSYYNAASQLNGRMTYRATVFAR